MNLLRFDKVSWFPGHMHRAMRLMEERISGVDVFIEVRDARVPLSSFNRGVDDIIRRHNKEKVVVFNKYDLCDRAKTDAVIEELKSLGFPSLAVSTKSRGFDFQSLLKSSRALKSERFGSVGLWMMVGGMPNVGKSQIINGLRIMSKSFNNNEVSKSSNKPCLTTYVSGFKVSEKPLAFLVDSPGILLPNIHDIRQGMNLGLVGSVKKSIIGHDALMEFLFETLGATGVDALYKKTGMSTRPKTPADMVAKFMEAFKIDNEDVASDKLLKMFQEGDLGKFTLDDTFKKLK